jgi:hypothetical protein
VRTFAAKVQDREGARYTGLPELDVTTKEGAAALLRERHHKKAAQRVIERLYWAVQTTGGVAFDDLPAPKRVLVALETMGLITYYQTKAKTTVYELTDKGLQMARQADGAS